MDLGETARRGQARRNGAGTAAFALFWSLIVGGVCVVVIAGTARQVASAYRPTADGTITVSEPTGRRAGGWKLA